MANNKRSGKFYRKNEAEIMLGLGLSPTMNSGSGWIEKEDGQSDEVICQLKSTDARSIKINKQDIETLEYNATVAHKIPVFAINYLSDNSVYLLVRPEDLQELVEYLNTGKTTNTRADFVGIDLSASEELDDRPRRMISSSSKSRQKFFEEKNKKYEKKSRRDR